MASLTTTPSRLFRSPTGPYPFFVFAGFGFAFAVAARGAFAFFTPPVFFAAAVFFSARAAFGSGALTGAASTGAATPCSLRIVYARARSLRAWLTRAGFLATPIDSWNRRLKISSDSSRTFCCISSPERSRHFAAFMSMVPRRSWLEAARARHELGRDADLLRRRAKRFLGHVLRDAFHLVEDAARLHHRHPLLRVALALAHARLCGLLRHRLVREDADPHLAAALEAAREGDAGRLDLAVGHPPRLQRLQPVLAEGQGGPALGLALHVAPLGLAVLDALGHQHRRSPLRVRRRLRQHFALEDPHLHADGAGGGVRGGLAVVDVGADGVQRHAAVTVPLAPRDLTAAEATGAGNADAVRAQSQGGRHRLLHGPSERHALLQLQSDVLGHELRVE